LLTKHLISNGKKKIQLRGIASALLQQTALNTEIAMVARESVELLCSPNMT